MNTYNPHTAQQNIPMKKKYLSVNDIKYTVSHINESEQLYSIMKDNGLNDRLPKEILVTNLEVFHDDAVKASVSLILSNDPGVQEWDGIFRNKNGFILNVRYTEHYSERFELKFENRKMSKKEDYDDGAFVSHYNFVGKIYEEGEDHSE